MLAMPKRLAHKHRRRPGFFHPVPLRARADGWSEVRQCAFLAQLYVTGSVAAAARSVGMTPKSAYRLRARSGAESFAAAWERVLTPPGMGRCMGPREDFRKVTNEALIRRLETGIIQPIIYRGRLCAIRRKSDNSALFRLLRRDGALRGLGRWDSPGW
jgi:hypothetical protein